MSEPKLTKQIIVIRSDLKMRRGKEIAQMVQYFQHKDGFQSMMNNHG